MAMLGLHCYTSFSLVVASGGYSLAAVREFPIAVASLVAEQGLQRPSTVAACGFSSCGFWALEHRLSSHGVGLVAPRHAGSYQTRDGTPSPALAGRFVISEPSGKPQLCFLFLFYFWLHHAACGKIVLRPGLNPGSWQGECRVLTTGPLGKSPISIISMWTEKEQSWAGVVKTRYLPIILYFQPPGYHLQ